MEISEIIKELEALAHPDKVKGRSRFAIPEENSLGISMPDLRSYAKKLGKDQSLADELWNSPIHEVKLLATMVAEPDKFPITKADAWMKYLYSWDLCDQYCANLLVKTPYYLELPKRWADEEGEFQRRAAFAMIAVIAVHRKKLSDEQMLQFKPLLRGAATDPRNFVKKAVNWAIRQIGKRNAVLRHEMLSFSEELLSMDDKTASWIARDAIRELKSK